MPQSVNRRRLSQPTLFHPPHRHPSLQAFPPDILEKTIRSLAALLRVQAILYIRQSSTYQVSHNVESQRLQYAIQDRLHHLGWQEIEVVDEDLARSAAGMVTRVGFERMVAEVCLGKVGAVAAREVSRFARNSRKWQQLVEVRRVVDTVLMNLETV
jgi:Resolvase, N terminal domain